MNLSKFPYKAKVGKFCSNFATLELATKRLGTSELETVKQVLHLSGALARVRMQRHPADRQ
jgi:hypothetical protein